MLFARDRGCTKPGCDAPAYHSQAHHVQGWASTRRTDITDLTLACGPDNRLAEKGWITRKNTHGDTEWLPPAHLDHGQPRINTFHHPEKLLHDDEEPG
ncbi:HNH endonuclease signature motif containing protein [Mycobacterium canetti]